MGRILGRRQRDRRGGGTPSASFFADWAGADDTTARTDRPRTFVDVDLSTHRPAIERAERRSERWARTARVRRGAVVLGASAAGIATVAVALHGTSAAADPSAHTWYRLRMCESSNNYAINTGNGYYGAYQFDLSTWRSVGGAGYPNQASPAEQDARALILYRERGWQPWTCAGILGLREDSDARSGRIGDIHPGGGSSGSGSHSGVALRAAGLPGHAVLLLRRLERHDQAVPEPDAPPRLLPCRHRPVRPAHPGHGQAAAAAQRPDPERAARPAHLARGLDRQVPPSGLDPDARRRPRRPRPDANTIRRHHHPAHHAPAFPGKRWYRIGDVSDTVKRFQDQMHRRGFFPAGTGQYGPLTLAMTEQLQRLNGLVPNGELGPNTWALAWTGRYHRPATAPAFPGKRWYHQGDRNSTIKRFQDQMHHRGFFPAGTGQYGPLTLAMVKQLQRLNGLVPNGELGPNTWSLAWLGRYHRP